MALFVALILLAATCRADALSIDPQQQFDFSQHLYDEGQYRRAAEEFQRFAFFFPLDPRQRTALLQAGRSFLHSGEIPLAMERFKDLTQREPLDQPAIEAYFMLAECYLQISSPSQAVIQLNNIIALTADRQVHDRAYLRIGWIHLEQTDWSGARRAFGHISAARRTSYGIDKLDNLLNQATAIPHKNPTLAGALSIIPGAGQVYCGRYEDGLVALLVNTGLIWAATDAFNQEQYALGGLLSFVGLGFYTANIYGAVSSAHKYNRSQTQHFLEQLKQHLTVGSGPAGSSRSGGLLLGLHFRF